MRASDIVKQLAVYLPTFVDDFTTNVAVSSLTSSGTTAIATTATDHGFQINQQVNISGALAPIEITSLTRSGILGTLVTSGDHDITENAGFTVQISGANEANFNGTFTLEAVPNRRTIIFLMDDSGATTATGTPLLLSGSNPFAGYGGLVKITATPAANQFQYEVPDGLYSPASGTITAKANPRIASASTFERLIEAYTKQAAGAAWLFVVLGDAVADKNRNIDTDATDNIQSGNYFNQRLIQNVQLYCFIPAKNEIAAANARDKCEELLKPICRSILAVKFPSLVENKNNPLMITGHGFQAYSSAYYVHQYAFEATLQLGESDIFVPADDVAFRDIDLTAGLDIGTETFNTLIDLDDEPLP